MPAIIFDMDGVIVDSTATHTEAWVVYLRNLGISADNLTARMLGKHNSELVRDLFGTRPLTEDDVFAHGAAKEALYRDMIRPVLREKLVPGIREFLTRHKNEPMAVATNAEPANVRFVLENAGLAPYFQAVVDGSQVARPKPHPDVFLKAAELLGHAPEDCVIFEDSLTGIQAARASGARVVGLTTSLRELPSVDLAIGDFFNSRLEPWLQELPASR
ncbi:MAG TPA: HAD family phosphatase [Bryobacteraceae bacterium]|nr:HAD family phosphatase [Bryobacteraceae bacterium]